jgi:hypothetical protein
MVEFWVGMGLSILLNVIKNAGHRAKFIVQLRKLQAALNAALPPE